MDAWLLRDVKRGLWYYYLSHGDDTRDVDLQCINYSACLSSAGNEASGWLGNTIYITRGLVISTFSPVFQQNVDEQSKFTIALLIAFLTAGP